MLIIGESCNWKPSQKKAAMAAINSLLLRHALPNVYEFAHLYPLSSQALKRWEVEKKLNPHHPKSAGTFSVEACKFVLETMECETNLDFQDKAFFAMTVYGGMRAEDVDCTHCDEVKIIPYDATTDTPRM